MACVHYSLYLLLVLICVDNIASVKSGFTTIQTRRQPIWNSTHTDKLRKDLLLNYDKFARPAQHYNKTTVGFNLIIRHVELNEFKSTLTVHGRVPLMWSDEKLKWNSSDYGGLHMLHLAEHEIWQPDISLYNSASTTSINHNGNSNCIVYEDGSVIWVPRAQFSVFCSINLKYWPFDVQDCFMIFASWTYNGDQIDLKFSRNRTEAVLELDVENAEWKIISTSMTKNVLYFACCPESYTNVTVNISIARISPSYKALIITPVFVVIVLTLLSFWLPPQSGEKIILNGFTIIIICLFMLYFTQKIPAMGNHTPLIVLFYTSALYVVTFSMIGSILVISLSRTRHTSSIPWVIKRSLTGTFGKLLGLETYIEQSSMSTHRITAEEMRDHQVTEFEDHNSGEEHQIIRSPTKTHPHQDWILLAAAIDRISFCFYCFLFSSLAIVYSV